MVLSLDNAGRLLPRLSGFSVDGQYAFVFFHSRLAVFSLSTRLQIKSFALSKANSFLKMFPSPKNSDIIYILDDKNTLNVLNWRSSSLSPIVASFALPNLENETETNYTDFVNFINENKFCFLTKKFDLVVVELDSSNFSLLAQFPSTSNYAISNNNRSLVFLNAITHELSVFCFDDSLENQLQNFTCSYLHKTPISRVAISNNVDAPQVALASSSGTIQLLYINPNKQTSNQRVLKWHINQPFALDFTHDGQYLISGGSEKVLVFWNIVTEKQQFLPRLNGSIVDIIVSEATPFLYGIILGLIDGESQFLILGSTDLISKLDVSSPRIFNGNNQLPRQLLMENKNPIDPNQLIDPKLGSVYKNLQKDVKFYTKNSGKHYKFKYSHDFQSKFLPHPITNNLYIPTGAHVQIYNTVKPSASTMMSIAPLVQQYGKVGNEQKIKDPVVTDIKFTHNANWLISLDVETRGEVEDNVGKFESIETLRFWKSTSTDDEFTLQTKIIQPHSSKITCIAIAPKAYFNGEAIATVDDKGSVKLWRPNSNSWTLRKFHSSNSTQLGIKKSLCCWSPDGSIIAVVNGGKVSLINVNTFETINSFELQDEHPQLIQFINDGASLLIATRTHVVSFNLLKSIVEWGIQIGWGNSIVKSNNEEVMIIGKWFSKSAEIVSRVSIWQNGICKSCIDYEGILIGAEWSDGWNKWVIVDINGQIGFTGQNSTSIAIEESNDEADGWMVSVLGQARVLNDVHNANSNANSNSIENDRLGLKTGVFDRLLDDWDVQLDVLFDRVVSVL
ncbi:Nan1 protein [Martiniozyma asiatica (nom. inval.)]|nr:Nan1 protein [Martiniozyma asiatica]